MINDKLRILASVVLCATCFLNQVVWNDVKADDIVVTNEAEFSVALDSASDGDRILMAAGNYSGGFFQADLTGVVICSQSKTNLATISGGTNGIQLSDATRVTIESIIFEGQSGNGLNIDDGGSFATPSTDIFLRDLTVRNITTSGNRDGIKLSGVTGFVVENVRIENWGDGGSAIDMVGCHHGLIQNSIFSHSSVGGVGSGVRPKGGSKFVTIRSNRFEMTDGRAIQAGGSTDSQFFRFIDGDSGYEADEIRVEGNVIASGSSSFSFVNIDGGTFHHNYAQRPDDWFVRILNENQGSSIVDTMNGRLFGNVLVFNDKAEEFNTAVNIGAETLPETFQFERNHWFNIANPANSTPTLPVEEIDGVYGVPPQFGVDEAIAWQFEWGLWLVNANASADSVEIKEPAQFLLATPGSPSTFDPLANDPFSELWSFQVLESSKIELDSFSQSYLRLRQPGDVNQDGDINLLDVDPFVELLSGGPFLFEADVNQDGMINLLDVARFVTLLSN